MEVRTVIRQTWLSLKPRAGALDLTLFLVAVLCLGSFSYLTGFAGGDEWMPASGAAVFQKREFWRAWTTMFAHADLGHILSNLFLFIPFSYMLLGHFSRFFFPIMGFFLGGVANLIVLATMPPQVTLVGVSGVVYWMGAAWLTLFLLIEKRDPPRRRWGKVILTTTAVFIPEAFRPEVSYLCHFIGFAFGSASALLLYVLQRKAILAAEIRDKFVIPPPDWIQEAVGEETSGIEPGRSEDISSIQ